MAEGNGNTKKKPIGRMVSFGIFSSILYAMVFSYQGILTEYFAKGAWYALLPITTAFMFSFVHGSFTNYFWSVLGIEATKKALRPRTEEKRPYEIKRPEPRPRLRVRL